VTADSTYPYASGELLENRNTYFFSPFQGEAFLAAWRKSRDDAAADLSQPAAAFTGPNQPAPTATEHLLRQVLTDLALPVRRPSALQVLDRLVQRFEVSKRIHGAYNDAWRPVDPTDYQRLAAYVLFAEAADAGFACSCATPYLNALLKCLDTLTALRARLVGDERIRVAVLIDRERSHVDALRRRVLPERPGA
jgi:methionyl-tRNA formyltransferase